MIGFVIGHPRSGTQFLSRLLSGDRPGVSGHEVLVELAPALIPLATAFYQGEPVAADVRALLSRYRQSTVAVDCNWKLTWILPLVREAFPEARLVHLVRDPRPNVRSCVALDYYGTLVDDARFAATDELRTWLRTLPPLRRNDWNALDPLQRNCEFWNETHRLAEAAAERPERYLRVRVEDLANDGPVQTLVDFLGLPMPPPEPLSRIRASLINPKHDEKRDVAELRPRPWSLSDEREVWARCGERALRYGYPDLRAV